MLRTMSAWLALALSLHATYSIAGVDTATRQVGGAGTSCVGAFSVFNIYGSSPDHGVVHAQALFNRGARDRAAALLALGTDPQAIIDEITSNAFDPDAARRQYAVIDLLGRSARFTGSGASAFAGDLGGQTESFVYAAQGNIITGRGVLERAGAAFEADSCDLAARLMRALEAGAEGGEGDTRCTPNGIPSDGAFIEVDRPGEPAGAYLRLRVENSSPQNPLLLLRRDFDAWRTEHPCPVQEIRDAGIETTSDAAQTIFTDAAEPPITTKPKESCSCTEVQVSNRTGAALSVLCLFGLGALRRRAKQR